MTLTEAMATKFSVLIGGATKEILGRNMPDKWLNKYAASDKAPAHQKEAAKVLLADSTEDTVAGATLRAAKPVAAAKPQAPAPAQPQAAPEPDEYQRVMSQEADELFGEASMKRANVTPDDGFGPLGAHPATPVMPKAVVPTEKPLPAEVPEWAKELFQRLEVVGMKADLAADASTTVLERMTEIATTLKKWASSETPAPAAGVGQGGGNGGGQFTTEKIETLKNKGRLSFKVKGGRYQKFGVTMWPEVLEAAGLKIADFPIGEEIDFRGYMAVYTNADANDEGKVYPDKIVKLVKQ